ncbi:hypothetical protein AVEN_163284-1 [Araneus ventricosus]|uniref:Uncharacterized protein n=1 Tax=Araneus ventricosus TaxID=182803 RepID=A0A4Y2QLN0_ARAVE|nr:hypothetical protein AVEN_163284-1 [Araneus ventricosus]
MRSCLKATERIYFDGLCPFESWSEDENFISTGAFLSELPQYTKGEYLTPMYLQYCDVFPSREHRSHEKENPVPCQPQTTGQLHLVVVKETFARVITSRRKATTLHRIQYLSESAYGVDYEEISGTHSCQTSIAPVVAKPKNLPHGWT